MLATLRHLAPCTPAEMASALRRLHQAGVRRGFVLVAPTALARNGAPGRELHWWSGLCDLIQEQTGLGVVLVDAAHAGLELARVLDGARLQKRIAVLEDLTRAERSALLDISRGVCTGDRGLLIEARALEAPNYEPWEAHAAILGEVVHDLFPIAASGALPASA
ncbi:MAG: hypothetical protein OXK77_09305 [Gemmatimonadota bacterium]|nr:hypothetical protein [Gemmatimonadota bacterium]MDE2866335.1 hypothetical protein [Gemmatimonadota bacterium]